jgi:putative Mn2+ efflux pump MntP
MIERRRTSMHLIYDIIYLTIIAFLNSIDNLGIAIAYSIAGKKVPLIKNLLISLMAFLVSFASSLSGEYVSAFFNEETCAVLSCVILVLMGSHIIYRSFRKEEENDDFNKYNIISNKEAITVGVILALDDVGSSVSSGLVGHGAFMVSIPFFIISFIMFFLANFGTRFTSKLKIGRKANAAAGVLMIIMGLLRLLE